MSGWQSPPVLVGERALWLGSGSGLPKVATVRWIGHLLEIGPDWTVGLELAEPLPVGGIDGTWRGRVLFSCIPKHGLIVPVSSIIPGSHLKHTISSLELCDARRDQGSSQLPLSDGPPAIQSVLIEQKSLALNKQKSLALNVQKTLALNEQKSLVLSEQKSLTISEKESLALNEQKRLALEGSRHKRRIAALPSSTSNEPDGAESSEDPATRAATLRVEEQGQEDSLKKRLRLFTESHGAIPRADKRYEFSSDEVVIDSLYAQRRQQFISNGRSQSESTHAFISASNLAGCRKERGNSAIFSIFRWFKRENRFDEFAPSAPPSPHLTRGLSSSCNSVDTLFSTATASSFAFVHPALYRPFGAANAPEKRIIPGPETDTYRNRLKHRDRIRELDKNVSLKKKYHLFGSGTLHRSADDVSGRQNFNIKSLESLIDFDDSDFKNSTLGRKKRKAPDPPAEKHANHVPEPNATSEIGKEGDNSDSKNEITPVKVNANRLRHRRTVSDSAKDRRSFVHVKGKRKAPPPPTGGKKAPSETDEISGTQSLGRKKRPAPPPPLDIKSAQKNENTSENQGSLSPEEKQRLIENISKLQVHAERRSLLITTPPSSPILNNKMSHTVCNDSLKLEKGILKANKTVQSIETKAATPTQISPAPASPTPVSPRPWYKRNSSNKDKSLDKKKIKPVSDNWMPEVAISRVVAVNHQQSNASNNTSSTSSNNNHTYRLSSLFSRFEKPEEKRKSQISMLVNISELDREAAEIVQKCHEKDKALLAAQDEKYYTSVPLIPGNSGFNEVNESANVEKIEHPRRTGARELISLFNAIGNVKKVTTNSSFFSKDNSIESNLESGENGILKINGTEKSDGKVVKEILTNGVDIKNETVLIQKKETYLESPGVKRRRNLINDNTGPSSSTHSAPAEVVEESNAEMSKTQAIYEANKGRKHMTPSLTIPTIAEMTESMSSVTSSTCSTLNANDNSLTETLTLAASPVVPPLPADHHSVVKPTNNYSIWSCPRCTLENPRWRVTCEACDMWRPAVRKDVIDKLTNANMGSTIAVNVIQGGGFDKVTPKTSSQIMNKPSQSTTPKLTSQTCPINTPDPSKSSVSNIGARDNLNRPTTDIKGPITVSGLLAGNSYQSSTDLNLKLKNKVNNINHINIVQPPITTNSSKSVLTGSTKKENAGNVENMRVGYMPKPSSSTQKFESEIEEVRKARLAFFKKSRSEDDGKAVSNEERTKKNNPLIDQDKIDTLFSIASKGSLATNDEERQKVKELLKQMKNSLPKRNKLDPAQEDPKRTSSKTDIDVKIKDVQASTSHDTSDASKLGAIRKTKLQNPITKSNESRKNDERKDHAEVFLIKSETIIEEIKIKSNNDSKLPKVSTSVQTNGVVRKIEPTPTSSLDKKIVTEKPPTPKSSRKEVIVPVTVKENVIKDGSVQSTTHKEARKMDIRAFDLIKPKDFMSIDATKTGKEIKPPLTHVYANIPSRNNDDSSSSSSSSGDSPEINQLTAQLTKPNGLADFKASVLESAAGNKMNTMAVNRLLRQLESAIAGGQHTRAATLARELARHKVNCCVTRHRKEDLIQLDMYVEDRQSHRGPFPVHVTAATTVAELKATVERQYEFPVAVQRWILGKALAAREGATLKELGADKPRTPIFLYLVTPDANQEKASAGENLSEIKPSSTSSEAAEGGEASGAVAAPPGRGWYFNDQDDRYSLCESEATDPSRNPSPEAAPEPESQASGVMIEEVETEEELVEEEVEEEEIEEEDGIEEGEGATASVAAGGGELAAGSAGASGTVTVGTDTIGWKCEVCTLINSPTRPGCLACTADRPAGYRPPGDQEAVGAQRLQIEEDQGTEEAAGEEKRRNYEQLVSLENADLITSSEAFECAVCLTEYAAGDGVVLRDCLHTFCRECLAHTVQFSEDAEVRCPFRDHSYACQSTLQEREIKAGCAGATDEEEDDSCIVCMAEPRACALTPCGHRAYCETCCLRLIQLDQMCSLCRRKADGYLLIYL